jgi:hypothetical protein
MCAEQHGSNWAWLSSTILPPGRQAALIIHRRRVVLTGSKIDLPPAEKLMLFLPGTDL